MPRPRRSTDDTARAIEVGRRLREVREGAGLSQAQFISRLGRGTRRALVDYEQGRVLLPTEMANLVCGKCDITFEWLMTGRGPQREGDLIKDAQSRRAEEEAYQALRALREVVSRHDRSHPDDDWFSKALRISLGRLEREFNPKMGVKQVAKFVDDLISCARDLMREDLRDLRQLEVNRAAAARWAPEKEHGKDK